MKNLIGNQNCHHIPALDPIRQRVASNVVDEVLKPTVANDVLLATWAADGRGRWPMAALIEDRVDNVH